MRSALGAGFVFWGLFLVFALIVVAYFLWMVWAGRRETLSAPGRTRSRRETLDGPGESAP